MVNKNINSPGIMPKGRGAAEGFKLVGFPREFERHFWEIIDKRYYLILLITWILFYSIIFYLITRDWEISESVKERIRKNYLEQLYAEVITTDVIELDTEGEGSAFFSGEGEGESTELSETGKQLISESSSERVQRRRAGVGARRSQRQQMEQEAAGYGILGALTASGSGGSGIAYADVLGEAGGTGVGLGNAGDLVSGAAALQAATGSGQRSRIAKGGGFGGEVGETGIDDLVTGTGVSGGASVVRRGGIQLAQDTEVRGIGAGTTQRDPDIIDAIINQNKASVEYCYQSQLKVDPNLRGEVLLNFDILPTGKVGAARIVESTLNNQKIERCIISSIKRWAFPALSDARGMVTIRTKFVFG
jgi:hypothetical protein